LQRKSPALCRAFLFWSGVGAIRALVNSNVASIALVIALYRPSF
jgi:hypothetical protein